MSEGKKLEEVTEEEYFNNKKDGWVRMDQTQGKLKTSLLSLAAAFKQIAEMDRANMIQTAERLRDVLEKKQHIDSNTRRRR